MKKIKILLMTVLTLALVSCGSGVKIDSHLSEEESRCVIATESILPRGTKIMDYQVVKSTLPLALMQEEYKGYRDQAYKARLDYRTNMTRGLDKIADKNLETLKDIKEDIVAKEEALNSRSPQYIFVLANVKENTRHDGNLTGYISVFDPENLEQVDLIQVTTPLYNNAVMVTEALEGTLSRPEAPDTENLHSDNPVTEFILRSSPK